MPGHGTVLSAIDGVQTAGRGPPHRTPLRGTRELFAFEAETIRYGPVISSASIPNHSCVVSNLVDALWMVDGMEVGEPLQVSARGRIT